MDYTADDIVNFAQAGNAVGMKDAVDFVLQSKIGPALQERRKQVASEYFNNTGTEPTTGE